MSYMHFDSKETGILFIDFQRDFCEEGGYADKFAGGTDWVKPILPNAKKLLDFARRHKWLIIHTAEGYSPDLSDCDEYRLKRSAIADAKIGSEGPMGRLLIRGEYGQDFIDLLKPQQDEIVIQKAAYGAFSDSDLLEILEKKGIKRLIFTGVTADVCVHTTLRQATDYGFECYYVKDAISTPDPEICRACEKMVEVEGGIWGHLTTTNEILSNV